MAEHHFGAVHVGLDSVHGSLDDQLDAHRRGQVEHHVGAVHELRGQRIVEHRIDGVIEAGPAFQVRDVVDGAGGQVVEDEDVVTGSEQGLRKM